MTEREEFADVLEQLLETNYEAIHQLMELSDRDPDTAGPVFRVGETRTGGDGNSGGDGESPGTAERTNAREVVASSVDDFDIRCWRDSLNESADLEAAWDAIGDAVGFRPELARAFVRLHEDEDLETLSHLAWGLVLLTRCYIAQKIHLSEFISRRTQAQLILTDIALARGFDLDLCMLTQIREVGERGSRPLAVGAAFYEARWHLRFGSSVTAEAILRDQLAEQAGRASIRRICTFHIGLAAALFNQSDLTGFREEVDRAGLEIVTDHESLLHQVDRASLLAGLLDTAGENDRAERWRLFIREQGACPERTRRIKLAKSHQIARLLRRAPRLLLTY